MMGWARRHLITLYQQATSSKIGLFLVAMIPLAWLTLFFAVPLLEILGVSLGSSRRGVPPFIPAWGLSDEGLFFAPNSDSYALLLRHSSDYLVPLYNSTRLAFGSMLICLVLAFPIALWAARARGAVRLSLLVMVLLPFWTSSLLRVYAVMGLLNPTGYVNQFLLFLGLIDTPLDLMRMDISVYFGIVISYLPLMALPLYAVLVRIDESLYEAATDLGATRTTTFMTITLPMARAGIVAGCLLVFIPAMGEFMIPELLGGPEQLMMGKVLWTEFFRSRDWPVAAALAVLLLLVLSIPILWLRHAERRMKET